MKIEIQGKSYIQVNYPTINKKGVDKLSMYEAKYGCLNFGVHSIIPGGFWDRTTVVIILLIPEDRFFEFHSDKN